MRRLTLTSSSSALRDTDALVLLTAYVFKENFQCKVLLEAFNSNRSLIDINETIQKHAEIVPSLIGAHTVSGCDSVPTIYGIGKKSVIKHLKQNLSLASVGNLQASLDHVHNIITRLVSLCYGVKNRTNLLQVRFTVLGKKTRKKLTSMPKLQSLSPTTEVSKEVNIQACIWNAACCHDLQKWTHVR